MLEAAEKVAKGELNSAFAIVRPPGHHAGESEPMGFYLFNSVAIATSFHLNQKVRAICICELGINKIFIVHWDVHHGNGTQKMFRKDSRVLHEYGSFYPTGDDGSHIMIGEGAGARYNINVPWENGQCEDADYITVWNHILIPVARDFNPEIIIIPTGVDAGQLYQLPTPHGLSILLIGGGMVSTMVLRSPKMMGYDNNESGNEGNSGFSVRFEILTKSDNLELCN
ncbi:putative histone deacetylase [Helianthus anomalus]